MNDAFFLKPEISSNCLHKQPQTDSWGSQRGSLHGGQQYGEEEAAVETKSSYYRMFRLGTIDKVQVFRVCGLSFIERRRHV